MMPPAPKKKSKAAVCKSKKVSPSSHTVVCKSKKASVSSHNCKPDECPYQKIVMDNVEQLYTAHKLCEKFVKKIKKLKN